MTHAYASRRRQRLEAATRRCALAGHVMEGGGGDRTRPQPVWAQRTRAPWCAPQLVGVLGTITIITAIARQVDEALELALELGHFIVVFGASNEHGHLSLGLIDFSKYICSAGRGTTTGGPCAVLGRTAKTMRRGTIIAGTVTTTVTISLIAITAIISIITTVTTIITTSILPTIILSLASMLTITALICTIVSLGFDLERAVRRVSWLNSR